MVSIAQGVVVKWISDQVLSPFGCEQASHGGLCIQLWVILFILGSIPKGV
jgi:hypothetical protein